MGFILDSATEQRIQRQLDRGVYTNPTELISHALDLVEAESVTGDWLLQNRDDIRRRLDESIAARELGHSYSAEEAERRSARVRQAA
jgi:Arc/MetJ-type ribon-helix-helix transcriptional regulator